LIAKDPVSGVLVKLAGNVTPDATNGRPVSVFDNRPQAPFESLSVTFFGGPRASVATPALCGPYATAASMTPWSGNAAATPTSSFEIASGPGGGPCSPNPQSFGPSFQAGPENGRTQGGGFTHFTLTIG